MSPSLPSFELTAGQLGIYRGHQLDPSSPVYNTAEAVVFHRAIDVDRLRAAIEQATREAEVLHARFVEVGDAPRQILSEATTVPIEWVSLEPEVSLADVIARGRDALGRPVDLHCDPLFRHTIYILRPERYVWVMQVHHVALDGFGYALVRRRVATLYTATMAGKDPPPCPFPPLARLLAEEHDYRQSPAFVDDRRFWHQILSDRPEAAVLSASTSRAVRVPRRRSIELPPEIARRLGPRASALGVTWPELVLAVMARYIHEHAGTPEPILGVPMMGRLGSAALSVPAMTMNIVPLRVPIDGDALSTVARRVAIDLRRIRPHTRYRYETLRRDLRALAGGRRLFGPVINILPFGRKVAFGSVMAEIHPLSAGPVEDLAVAVRAQLDGRDAQVDIEANADVYDADTFEAHARAIVSAIEQAVIESDNSASSVHAIGIAPSSASWAWQMDSVHWPSPLSEAVSDVVDRIVEHAQRRPHAVAVEDGATKVDYLSLVRDAHTLAARLREQHVGVGDTVVILLPRGVAAITSMVATLMVGAAYLPLNPDGPVSRNCDIVEEAQPRAVIGSTPPEWLSEAVAFLSADSDTDPTAANGRPPEPDHDPVDSTAREAPTSVDPRTPAYIIYTSGSTGKPNGVVIPRGALSHFVAAATERYAWSTNDRVLQFAALPFDASVEEIYLSLCNGGTLVIRPPDTLESLPRLAKVCAEHELTVLDLPTALWHELTHALTSGLVQLPASLRLVIIGGEAAAADRVARWHDAIGSSPRLLNTYGPTETTVVALCAELTRQETGPEIPIGLPLPGLGAAVLNEQGRLAARGEIGELVVFGPTLARGYIDRPAVNAQRFVVLRDVPGRPRGYKTGDRVRQTDDGSFVFMGRVDDECKINGYRVDPREVEAALLGHPQIQQAAVVVRPGPSLVAFYVAQPPLVDSNTLREFVRKALIPAAMPSRFVAIDHLPLNVSGKLDRRALEQMDPHGETKPLTSESTLKLTALQETVRNLFAEVLGLEHVTPSADFFELGGESIRALRVSTRLGETLGREVPVTWLLDHPTVLKLSAALDGSAGDGVEASTPTRPIAEMRADAVLPADIEAQSFERSSEPQTVLLTGATGFVGTHLLHELLASTSTSVICLVRAHDQASARARLHAALEREQLLTNSMLEWLTSRVATVPGDLTQPQLGCSRSDYFRLRSECDAIVHAAASVSLARGYASLRAANVLGTLELLRLASAETPKPLHYVSTLAAAPGRQLEPRVPEAFVPLHDGLIDGYTQSKWVAERLLEQAAHRGLPIAVYRLGRVVGSVVRATTNPHDVFWRIVRAGLGVRRLPHLDVSEVWTPVDYVAQTIVHLAVTRPLDGSVINIAPSGTLRWRAVFEQIRDFGYSFEIDSLASWIEHLRTRTDDDSAATLALFRGSQPAHHRELLLGLGHVDNRKLRWGLAGSDILPPSIDRALVHRYLAHGVASGLLPAPLR